MAGPVAGAFGQVTQEADHLLSRLQNTLLLPPSGMWAVHCWHGDQPACLPLLCILRSRMGALSAPLAPNGGESPDQELRGPGAQQLPANNEAVALATESGLSLGLKAESGNRCLKNRRWEQRGLGCSQSCLSLRKDAEVFSREDDRSLLGHSSGPLLETLRWCPPLRAGNGQAI